MSEYTQESLAKRLVNCRHFRWLPGMRERATGWRWSGTAYISQERYPESGNCIAGVPEPLPDLTDPATLGCLLALVRETHGAVMVRPPEDAPRVVGWWEVERLSDGQAWGTSTEAGALVAALEAAP